MASKLFWEEKGVLFSHSGTVTPKEVLKTNDIMYGDVRYESITYQISDYSEVTMNFLTTGSAKVAGTLDRTSARWSSKKMRIAVVTKDEKFVPVVMTYFKEFDGTDWEGRLFETLEMAYEWVKMVYL